MVVVLPRGHLMYCHLDMQTPPNTHIRTHHWCNKEAPTAESH